MRDRRYGIVSVEAGRRGMEGKEKEKGKTLQLSVR